MTKNIRGKGIVILVFLMLLSSAHSNRPALASDAISAADSYTLGSHILFGSYEQDDDISNGKEPLEWIVLDQTGDKVLLITRCIIDFGYNYKLGVKGATQPYTWFNSSLRKWLNDGFMRIAFSLDEQAAIVTTTVKAEKNPYNDYSCGQNSQDHVFLLSSSETIDYLKNDNERKADPSVVIKRNPYSAVGQVWRENLPYESNKRGIESYVWVLRAPGKDTYAVIGADGKAAKSYGWDEYVGIRPVCWIDTTVLSQPLNPPIVAKIISPEISIGTEVLFGRYQSNPDINSEGKPLKWVVVGRDNNKILLLSKYILTISVYSKSKKSSWEQSQIRNWMNGTLLNTAFTTHEQEAMSIRTVLAEKSGAGKTTHDKLFLLSRTELDSYITDPTLLIASSIDSINDKNITACSWWLRSSAWGTRYADVVSDQGAFMKFAVNTDKNVGVRPACWINLESLSSDPLVYW